MKPENRSWLENRKHLDSQLENQKHPDSKSESWKCVLVTPEDPPEQSHASIAKTEPSVQSIFTVKVSEDTSRQKTVAFTINKHGKLQKTPQKRVNCRNVQIMA